MTYTVNNKTVTQRAFLQRTSFEMIESLTAVDLVREQGGARRRSQSYGEHVRHSSRAKDQGQNSIRANEVRNKLGHRGMDHRSRSKNLLG